ncbi:paeninodin family lasso peptide [Paenibacillus paeoniae]|uniref:Paeninodin family lasso peptide n=1 Tax=Paenibacillus paeoniae TaxID=2292705 RepID=A0A371PHY8_9BACL|nr:paeninodin family lasso peptide [Paenibacillus paeoniae]REK75818.1 paeninodin family lasso peptide [Paenibacillus paeoniae]
MMMAKKEWNKPELEVLQVNLTEASTHNGPFTDEAYVPGSNNENPRFTS